MRGRVDVVEHLGNEQFVYLTMPGAKAPAGSESNGAVTARVAPSLPVRVGETLTLAVDPERVHIFDPATTKRFV